MEANHQKRKAERSIMEAARVPFSLSFAISLNQDFDPLVQERIRSGSFFRFYTIVMFRGDNFVVWIRFGLTQPLGLCSLYFNFVVYYSFLLKSYHIRTFKKISGQNIPNQTKNQKYQISLDGDNKALLWETKKSLFDTLLVGLVRVRSIWVGNQTWSTFVRSG